MRLRDLFANVAPMEKTKNLTKFSQLLHHLNSETAVKRHFATYSQNLTHTLQKNRVSPSFSRILFSWPNIYVVAFCTTVNSSDTP